MEWHFLTTWDMCSSQDKVQSTVTPSIFTNGEGLRTKSWIRNWDDDAFLSDWRVPTSRSEVLLGFIFKELAVKKDNQVFKATTRSGIYKRIW